MENIKLPRGILSKCEKAEAGKMTIDIFFIVKEGKLEKFGSSSSSTDKLAVEKYLRDRKN